MNLIKFILENLFFIQIGMVFLVSGALFTVLMHFQKIKEAEAERKFIQTLKARGLNVEVEDARED